MIPMPWPNATPAEPAAPWSLLDAHAQHIARADDAMVKAMVWALRNGDDPEALVAALVRHVAANP